jgi:hypothetical protein
MSRIVKHEQPSAPEWATATEADEDPKSRVTRFTRQVGTVDLLPRGGERLVVRVAALAHTTHVLRSQVAEITDTATPVFVDVRRVMPERKADEPGALSADHAEELADLLRQAADLARQINARGGA